MRIFLVTPCLAFCLGCPPTESVDAGNDSVVSAIIGAAGGSLSNGAGVELEIPAGALDHDVEISIAAADSGILNAALPSGHAMQGTPYTFTPHGTNFSVAATIRLPFAGTADAVLRLDDESDSSWESMSDANFGVGLAIVQTMSFSIMVPTLYVSSGDAGYPDSSAADASSQDSSGGDARVPVDAGEPDCVVACTGDEICMWRPYDYAPNGGYWECKIPCNGDGDCPVFVPECVDSVTITGGGWWCENSGCVGIYTEFACVDNSGNPTACVNGDCQ
ncbi:MAG: hypothetical protein ABIJ09_17510 [Pseudomonadota bacterium]